LSNKFRWWQVVAGGGRWWQVMAGGGRWWQVVAEIELSKALYSVCLLAAVGSFSSRGTTPPVNID